MDEIKSIKFPKELNTNYEFFNFICDFYEQYHLSEFESIIFDFTETRWIDANLVAVLRSIIDLLRNEFNTVESRNLSIDIQIIFMKNRFLNHVVQDVNKTTMELTKFKRTDELTFADYLDKQLFSKNCFPAVSDRLRGKIKESILEVFSNAVIHTNTEYIYTCGQFYPKKNRFDVTIVNTGKTIKDNVNEFLHESFTGSKSIEWAIEGNNSTKKDNTPGGLGLKIIREFIKLNKGKVQIISADGYFEQNEWENVQIKNLNNDYPGTVINFEFKTDDTNTYILTDEKDVNDYL